MMTPLRWFTLGAIIGLLAVLALIFAATANAHEWFRGRHNPTTGFTCCNNADCRPIETENWREEAGRYVVKWTDGQEYSLPASQAEPSEDHEGKAAACVWGGKLRCFFVPVAY